MHMKGICLLVYMQNMYPEYNVLTIVYIILIAFLQRLILTLVNPE